MRQIREGVAAGLDQAAREVEAQVYQLGEMAASTSTPAEDRVLLTATRTELQRIASTFSRMADEWNNAARSEDGDRHAE